MTVVIDDDGIQIDGISPDVASGLGLGLAGAIDLVTKKRLEEAKKMSYEDVFEPTYVEHMTYFLHAAIRECEYTSAKFNHSIKTDDLIEAVEHSLEIIRGELCTPKDEMIH